LVLANGLFEVLEAVVSWEVPGVPLKSPIWPVRPVVPSDFEAACFDLQHLLMCFMVVNAMNMWLYILLCAPLALGDISSNPHWVGLD
jgi:hypothetical protein